MTTKIRKRPVVKLLEDRHGKPIRELLVERLRAGKTLSEIAIEWDVEAQTVQKWAFEQGIRQKWTMEGRVVADVVRRRDGTPQTECV